MIVYGWVWTTGHTQWARQQGNFCGCLPAGLLQGRFVAQWEVQSVGIAQNMNSTKVFTVIYFSAC